MFSLYYLYDTSHFSFYNDEEYIKTNATITKRHFDEKGSPILDIEWQYNVDNIDYIGKAHFKASTGSYATSKGVYKAAAMYTNGKKITVYYDINNHSYSSLRNLTSQKIGNIYRYLFIALTVLIFYLIYSHRKKYNKAFQKDKTRA